MLVKFHVVQDIPNIPDLLIGNDCLKTYLGTVGYTGDQQTPVPEVHFRYPVQTSCTVYQASPLSVKIASAFCKLGPFESMDIDFTLNPAAPVTRSDFILISAISINELTIIPSRSELTFSHSLGAYLATARVANISNSTVETFCYGQFEIITDSTAIPIKRDNISRLKKTFKKYPLGREIFPRAESARVKIPLHTINLINIPETPGVKVSDLNLASTVCLKEPSYEGEAVISPEIIQGGLNLPNIIYNIAEEAVGLYNCSPLLGSR